MEHTRDVACIQWRSDLGREDEPVWIVPLTPGREAILELAAPETQQHIHQHVYFTSDQLQRMTDDQLDRVEAASGMLVTLEQEVNADEARRARFGARL